MHRPTVPQATSVLSLYGIISVAALFRIVWAWWVPIEPISDPGAYDALARMLLEHGVYGFEPDQPIAIWPPGTAAFYALIYALPGSDLAAAKVVNVTLSLLNVLLVWAVGRQLFDDITGRVAALIMAVWPQMIYFTTLIASEPIFIFIVLLAILLWERSRTLNIAWLVAAGLLFGAACYVRSVALLLPIVLTFGVLVLGSMGRGKAVVRLAVVGAVMAMTIAPWTARNQEVFGDRIVMSSNFGGTLYMGNAPGTSGRHGSVELPEDVRAMVEGLPQPERSSLLGDIAKREILANPGAFVLRSLNKVRIVHDRETIGVAWNQRGLDLLGFGDGGLLVLKAIANLFWWSVLALGLFGVVWQVARGAGWRFLLSLPVLVWVYFAGIHAIVLAADRFHMPQTPFIAMIAAAFIVGWLKSAARINASGRSEKSLGSAE
jgi:4-amino-4-deoxy-L-arabinose transferase-like glycosyltransferase